MLTIDLLATLSYFNSFDKPFDTSPNSDKMHFFDKKFFHWAHKSWGLSKFPKHWPVEFAAEFRTEPLRWGDRWPTSADIRVSLGALPCRESALRWVGRTFLIFHPLFPFVKEPFNIHSHVRECLRRKGGTNHVGDFCLFFLPCILVEQDQGTSVQKTVWVW